MNNLKRLGSAVVLLFVLGIPALAGDIPTPPCAPGEMMTPPCASGQAPSEAPAAPGQMETPPASESMDIISLAEIALEALLFF